MPMVYISKELYDRLILLGEDPPAYMEKAAQEKLDKRCNGQKPQPQKAG